MELFHLLRVIMWSSGPDTELLVANYVELFGRDILLIFLQHYSYPNDSQYTNIFDTNSDLIH